MRTQQLPPSSWVNPYQSMEINEVFDHIELLPLYYVLDTCVITMDMRIVFAERAEHYLNYIFDCITNRSTASFALQRMITAVDREMRESAAWSWRVVDNMVATIEACALAIVAYLDSTRTYVNGKYLPYTFENLNMDGAILLKRITDYESFCDTVMLPDLIGAESFI